MSFGAPDAKGRQLIHLIEGVAGIYDQDVEGPKELLETEVSGDFLAREEASKAEVVAALERILWLECELKIKLTLREVERDVILVRGQFRLKPRNPARPVINLYGETFDPGKRGGGTGSFADVLLCSGRFLDPPRRLVNEVKAPPGELTWALHADNKDSRIVLKHLEEQTGLTFTPEKRRIKILVVGPAK